MTPCVPRVRRGARGFSLLELLVAMAILAMSLALLYQVDAGVLRGVAALQMQQRATVLAQSILDSRDAVPAAGWQEQGQIGEIEWQVHSRAEPLPAGLNEATPRLHRIEIELRWPGRNGPKAWSLVTLRPQSLPLPAGRAP